MSIYQKTSGSPFLYDTATNDIVGLKDPDGSEAMFPRNYGMFQDNTTQTNAGALADPVEANIMSFDTTDFAYGVSISGSDNDKIKIANGGYYDIQFSAQVDKTTGTTVNGYIWLAKNGNDLPNTNTQVTLAGGVSDAQVAAWNFYVSASAGDYYELRYGADQTNFRIHYNTAQTVGPAVPSLILTVGRIA